MGRRRGPAVHAVLPVADGDVGGVALELEVVSASGHRAGADAACCRGVSALGRGAEEGVAVGVLGVSDRDGRGVAGAVLVVGAVFDPHCLMAGMSTVTFSSSRCLSPRCTEVELPLPRACHRQAGCRGRRNRRWGAPPIGVLLRTRSPARDTGRASVEYRHQEPAVITAWAKIASDSQHVVACSALAAEVAGAIVRRKDRRDPPPRRPPCLRRREHASTLRSSAAARQFPCG